MVSDRAAANDHKTTIPKTDERVSTNWERNGQCHEGGREPPDSAEVFGCGPPPERAASQAHLANARRLPGGDLAASRCHVGGGAGFGGQGAVRVFVGTFALGGAGEASADVSTPG